MAARNSSRGTRLSGRSGGNRPRTHPDPKPRRKPVTNRLRNPLLRKAAKAFRKAHEHHERAEAIFKAAQAAEPARTPAVETLQCAQELREIRQQLDLVCSCVIVVHHALTEQNALLDNDAALVLKRHASDPLYEQVLRIGRLLGDPPDDDDEEGQS